MGKVVDFQREPKEGDRTFALCGCTDEGSDMIPVVVMGNPPLIVALVCTECEREAPVVNGYLEPPEETTP